MSTIEIIEKNDGRARLSVIAIAFVTVLALLVLTGCGASGGTSNQTIVGSWSPTDGSGYTMVFHDSGNCENVTYKGRTSDVGAGHYTKYELESDGTVFIIGDYWGDRAATVKKVDNQSEAANDYNRYCIDGDTLIWDEKIYKRV